jgi:hypothetical protein
MVVSVESPVLAFIKAVDPIGLAKQGAGILR